MIKIGLTGNIGCGKSVVAKIFETLGVPVYHADLSARKFLDDNDIKNSLRSAFGDDIFDQDLINRNKLASIVFNDKSSLDYLNSLIHPKVKSDLNKWVQSKKEFPYIIQEAAILFESGFNREFDKVILVICPDDLAIQRVMKRDHISEAEVRRRQLNQWPQKQKITLSDYVINNDGNELLIPQVLTLHKQFIS
ncbi:MAG: dephospho-CoA kinase [Bacteroidales bacterium]